MDTERSEYYCNACDEIIVTGSDSVLSACTKCGCEDINELTSFLRVEEFNSFTSFNNVDDDGSFDQVTDNDLLLLNEMLQEEENDDQNELYSMMLLFDDNVLLPLSNAFRRPATVPEPLNAPLETNHRSESTTAQTWDGWDSSLEERFPRNIEPHLELERPSTNEGNAFRNEQDYWITSSDLDSEPSLFIEENTSSIEQDDRDTTHESNVRIGWTDSEGDVWSEPPTALIHQRPAYRNIGQIVRRARFYNTVYRHDQQYTEISQNLGYNLGMSSWFRSLEHHERHEQIPQEIATQAPSLMHYATTIKRLLPSDRDVTEPCSICHEDMGTEEDACYLPCNHLYHLACISEWCTINPRCPYCRQHISNSSRT
ncbi:hypothetical protein BDF20DRAFT_914348 [Mycotypha africana]|uniref:uncharacterized protein n=1 Tax=Mycotypha africana TaxID=64632 RepID=UPI0023012B98|nr:uncharacterized protein BDF20DRAFT_914348 [Mycotypha africana]KAI8975414.1 hypothetical protein BDF20DRAFT_914348 [Mycotypha africana]